MLILPLAVDTDNAMAIVALSFISIVLLLLALNLFLLWKGRSSRTILPNEEMPIDLEATPLPPEKNPTLRLCILGNPFGIRYVVVAPTGPRGAVDPTVVNRVLDKAYPGLAAQYVHDKAQLKVWPPQLSRHGFAPSFFRNAKMTVDDSELSRWVLLAGEVMVGKKLYLLGLALWTDEPCTVGKILLDGPHWMQYISILTVNIEQLPPT
jgi:hypothetical protein